MSAISHTVLAFSKLPLICIMFILLIFTFSLAEGISGTTNSVKIFSPDSKPYGLSYEDHVKDYWKITLAIKATDHPWVDPTGEKCLTGQSASNTTIFYLPTNDEGESKERTCKIPAGLGLFIPVIVGEMSLLEARMDNPSVTPQDLPNIAKKDFDQMTNLELRINDKNFTENEIKKYGVLTSPFNVTFARPGLFGQLDGGSTVAAANGYYVITEPLSKGTYYIHTSGRTCSTPNGCPTPQLSNFFTLVETKLIVE